MNHKERVLQHHDDDQVHTPRATGGRQQWARKLFLNRLTQLQRGRLVLNDSAGRHVAGPGGGPEAQVQIHDESLYLDISLGGALGAAEAFMAGKWSSPDLTAVIRVFAANRHVLLGLETGLARLVAPVRRAAHWLHRNTRRQSRRNIHAHYDLGNEFFQLFLDPTMMYSAAIFPRPDSSLEEAAVHKLDVICRKLDLQASDHLLEIGTGWGGLAIHAAREYGCRVTTTTISEQQHALARARIEAAGLGGRIELLSTDYRDLGGRFDKLVSVEMIEAVGPQFMPDYFRVCSDRLKPGGRALIQAIVMTDRNYQWHLRSVDFIKRYIFPGGGLPSVGSMMAAAAGVTDLQLVQLHDIGVDYARTLREWRRRFMARLDDVRRLGYPEEFIRRWQFYLAYCEGGFMERLISDVQVVFDKPHCRLTVPG